MRSRSIFQILVTAIVLATSYTDTNLRGIQFCQPEWTRVVNRFNPVYYDMSKMYNKQVLSYPLYIYMPVSVEDVQDTVCWGKQLNLRIAVRGGGRGFFGSATCDNDCIMLDMTRLNDINYDENTRILTVGAGVRARDIHAILGPKASTLSLGLCGPVGIVGLSLGGGYGFLSHSQGLTTDHLVSAQVVLANSTVVTASEHSHSDLFWALRGAGHVSYGIVTELKFHVDSVSQESVFQYMVYNVDPNNVVKALEIWQNFSQQLPKEGIYTRFVLASSNKGTLPQYHFIVIFNSTRPYAEHVMESSKLLPLSTLAPCKDPLTQLPSKCKDLTWSQLILLTAKCGYEADSHFTGASNFAKTPLTDKNIQTLVSRFGTLSKSGCESTYAFINVDRFNGAISTIPQNATAFVHRDKMFLFGTVVIFLNGRSNAICRDWTISLRDTLASFTSYDAYVNYEDYNLPHWELSYYGGNYERLKKVKSQYDPHNLFRFQQSVQVD